MMSFRNLRFPLLLLAGLLSFGTGLGLHLLPQYVWQTGGSFLALTGLLVLAVSARETISILPENWQTHVQRLGAILRRFGPVSIIVVLALGVLFPAVAGNMPMSHDHPVHLFKAWHFVDEMLSGLRLRGWSSFWFFGYPAEELYPIGPDIWVALFRFLTLGLLSWEATYAISFAGVFAFAAYAVYSFGRRHFGTTAAVIAGVAWVLDPGAYREGGWSYTVDWAVWVQVMAMAFVLLTFARLEDVLEKGRIRDYIATSLLFAAALLSHQMNVILLGLGLPLLVISRSVTGTHSPGRDLVRIAAIGSVGSALSAFWLLPMLARKGWTTNIGDLWRPLDLTARGLIDGTVFSNVWPALVLLGVLGAILGFLQRRWVVVFLSTLAGALLLAASSTAFHEFDLLAISSAFGKIQYQRFTIPAKVSLFLLAGYAVDQVFRNLRRGQTITTVPWTRRIALILVAAALLAPFARPAALQLGRQFMKGVASLQTPDKIAHYNDYLEFLEWSSQQREESDEFYRISYELQRHDHTLMAAPVHNRTPYYKIGYTPAKLFKHAPETSGTELYKALSVRFVVARRALAGRSLKQVARFGSIRVYEFGQYSSQRYTLLGPGQVTVEEFGEEEILLHLSDTTEDSRLRLHVSNYPRWQATVNGSPVTIEEAPVSTDSDPMLMEIPVTDGEVAFAYVSKTPDLFGALLTWLGLLLLVLLAIGHFKPTLLAPIRKLFGPLVALFIRIAPAVFVLCIAGALVFALVRVQTSDRYGQDGRSFTPLLSDAEVLANGKHCTDRRGDKIFCSGKDWNYVGPASRRFAGTFLPCIWAHPVKSGPLEIHFPATQLGTRLIGHHGLADSAISGGGASVSLEVLIDGESVGRFRRPNREGWEKFEIDTSNWEGVEAEVTLQITTTRAGRRHYCFDLFVQE
jgi:hypothetical protein